MISKYVEVDPKGVGKVLGIVPLQEDNGLINQPRKRTKYVYQI
jgi:hypothetical protein